MLRRISNVVTSNVRRSTVEVNLYEIYDMDLDVTCGSPICITYSIFCKHYHALILKNFLYLPISLLFPFHLLFFKSGHCSCFMTLTRHLSHFPAITPTSHFFPPIRIHNRLNQLALTTIPLFFMTYLLSSVVSTLGIGISEPCNSYLRGRLIPGGGSAWNISS